MDLDSIQINLMIMCNHLINLIKNLFGISSEIMAYVVMAQKPVEQGEIVMLIPHHNV